MKTAYTLLGLTLGIALNTQAQNLGINTDGSTPDSDAILHINNHSGSGKDSSVVRIENEQNGVNDVTGVEIYNSGTGVTAKWDVYIPASGSTDLRIKNNGTDRITIQNDGDVGIGTTSPVSGLDIQSSMGYKVNTITSATTLDNTHNVVLCNTGPYTVTLPAAASNTGRVYYIKNIDTDGDDITVDGNGVETIDGSVTYILDCEKDVISIISDGSNWFIIDKDMNTCEPPTASAGAALSAICQGETSAAMGGSVGGSATGGTWTGGAGTWTNANDPSTATYTADASESGNITLTLTTSGGSFGTTTATKSITVNANTAGAASSTPTLCINTALTNITHTTTGATGIGTATGLPAGVTAAWASNTITISGTPTATGTFNYSIPLTGGCGSVNATGTITVTAANTAGTASSTPTLEVNTALTAITHATSDATGIGAATGLPAGVTAAWASNTITISGTPTEDGTFNYSIPLTGGCGSVNATGTITVTAAAASIPGNATCTGAIISATPCSSVSGATINDNGSTTLGTEYNWTGATTSGMANTSTTRAIVDIGGQCWMRYNMNIAPTAPCAATINTGCNTWLNTSPGDIGSWGYNNTATTNGTAGWATSTPGTNEGLLYQWSAAMNNSTTERAQGICPSGWHIPSDCEWMYLENTLGMSTTNQQAAGWRTSGDVDYDLSSAVLSGTNNSGFTGLLAGFRDTSGPFFSRTSIGYWWSSSATGATSASRRLLNTGRRGVHRFSVNKAGGFSVRCLKD
jgi:uncharacterized protein (TIGR02145 family)